MGVTNHGGRATSFVMPEQEDAHTTELLNIEEVAHELSCGRTFVFTLINAGELQAIKLGRLTRVPRASIRVLVKRKLDEVRHTEDNVRSGRPVGLQPVRTAREGNRGGQTRKR